MAITQNPLIGRTRKSVGNIVFYKLYDKNIIRTKPLVFRDNPNEKMLNERFEFAKCVKIASTLCKFFDYMKLNEKYINKTRSNYSTLISQLMNSFSVENFSIYFNKSLFNFGNDQISNFDYKVYFNSDTQTFYINYIPTSDSQVNSGKFEIEFFFFDLDKVKFFKSDFNADFLEGNRVVHSLLSNVKIHDYFVVGFGRNMESGLVTALIPYFIKS